MRLDAICSALLTTDQIEKRGMRAVAARSVLLDETSEPFASAIVD